MDPANIFFIWSLCTRMLPLLNSYYSTLNYAAGLSTCFEDKAFVECKTLVYGYLPSFEGVFTEILFSFVRQLFWLEIWCYKTHFIYFWLWSARKIIGNDGQEVAGGGHEPGDQVGGDQGGHRGLLCCGLLCSSTVQSFPPLTISFHSAQDSR